MSEPTPERRPNVSAVWLIAGLGLGAALLLAAVVLIELATGHDLLGSVANEKATLVENQRLKESVQTAERGNQATLRAKDEAIRNLQSDLDILRRKTTQVTNSQPPQKDDFWGLVDQMARRVEQKQGREAKAHLSQVQQELAQARIEIEQLKKKNKELEASIAKGGDTSASKDDLNKGERASDLEEYNAKSQLEKSLDFVGRDKEMAIKLLKKLIETHPKTNAAKEAKSMLIELMK